MQKIITISIFAVLLLIASRVGAENQAGMGMLVGDEEAYISPSTCGKSARFIIEKNKLQSIHSCKEEVLKVNGKKVFYVEIDYGKGMDCPSGCIYRSHSSIVVNKREYGVVAKPISLRAVNEEVGELFRCWLDDASPKKVTLINDKGGYKWKIFYNHTKTDEFGNTCVVKGHVIAGKQNDISNISVTFPETANDCKENDKCMSNVAEAKLDVSLCSRVKDLIFRNACYVGIAVRKSDRSLCDKPIESSTYRTDEFQKKRCLNAINRKSLSKKAT